MRNFWDTIRERFRDYPSQLAVVRKIISLGLSVVPGPDGSPRVTCDNIEVRTAAIAQALGVDRRVVAKALRRIIEDPELRSFFGALRPTTNLSMASSKLGLGVIRIIPTSASHPGIIAGVSRVIADFGISIRQVIVDDPELVENPTALIVTDGPVPPEVIPKIRKVQGVEAVTIL
ncbi:amino acid-binding protein [Thermogymnomonas acidicola]|uniref:Amino acid-binding protein n=1 Tax=Thermogymnomonas acidicola TaxID=399579 RepID=A0AA37BQF2_9ARCH|nr:ACT domain-containing protein [Thermogymnomonas acidicola]GGM70223.1 amino acid-binding protein [Thermogymnomonas acidicola]